MTDICSTVLSDIRIRSFAVFKAMNVKIFPAVKRFLAWLGIEVKETEHRILLLVAERNHELTVSGHIPYFEWHFYIISVNIFRIGHPGPFLPNRKTMRQLLFSWACAQLHVNKFIEIKRLAPIQLAVVELSSKIDKIPDRETVAQGRQRGHGQLNYLVARSHSTFPEIHPTKIDLVCVVGVDGDGIVIVALAAKVIDPGSVVRKIDQ